MQTKFLTLLSAATLSLGACSREKPAEITAAVPEASRDTAAVVADTTLYHEDARHLADRVATDLNLTDAEAKRRLENTYYVRRSRLGEVETRYTTDTVGRYAALRTVNDDTDREIKSIIIEPNQYQTYESSRSTYYDGGPYTPPAVVSSSVTTSGRAASRPTPRRGPAVVKYEKDKNGETKIEYANGTKVKIDEDGSRKIKRANGSKVKYDEDGRKEK